MSDIFINYKEENPIYAPGIGTYSTTGEKGDTGKNGNGVYYYPASINQNEQAINSVNSKISDNKLLYSTTYEDNPNLYQENDIIIDSFGEVFRIVKDENEKLKVGQCIGSIAPNSPNFFKLDGNNIKLKSNTNERDVFDNYVINIYTNNNQYYNVSSADLSNAFSDDSIIIEVCSISDGVCTKYKLK